MKRKKGIFKGFFGDIIFAVFVATFVGALFMKAYAIPTPSMEGTLLVGDHMFVSKIQYGPRLPETLFQVPLTHQKIWGTEIPSYLEWIKLPYYRLPGLSKVDINDIVVFNYPAESEIHPVDLRTYYVKRCVGLPSDTFRILDQQVSPNNIPLPTVNTAQSSYFIETNTNIRDRIFQKHRISDYYKVNGGYLVHASEDDIEDIAELNYVKATHKIVYRQGEKSGEMYNDPLGHWNIDNYGPVYIPKKGDKIELSEENIILYKDLIFTFERQVNLEFVNGQILQDNVRLKEYTFQQDYYFMMGDNRHNSEDSRFWGLVPEDHIVGKPLFIYWSVDKNPDQGFFSSIRWNRIFKWVADS